MRNAGQHSRHQGSRLNDIDSPTGSWDESGLWYIAREHVVSELAGAELEGQSPPRRRGTALDGWAVDHVRAVLEQGRTTLLL